MSKNVNLNKLPQSFQLFDFNQLKLRLFCSDLELIEFIFSIDLPIYEKQGVILRELNKEGLFEDIIDDWEGNEEIYKDWFFKGSDIVKIEKDIGLLETNGSTCIEDRNEAKLSTKESRELGQLRREKEKWDLSIEASIYACLFCSNQEIPVTRKQLWDELEKGGFGSIPDSTFEKIWKAIPSQFRNRGGRPKGSKQNDY